MAYKTQKVKEKYIPKSARLLDRIRETYGIIITQSVGSGHALRSTPCPRGFNSFLNVYTV